MMHTLINVLTPDNFLQLGCGHISMGRSHTSIYGVRSHIYGM